MTYYAALDVGLHTTAVCIVDGDGEIQLEKRLASEVDDIVTCLRGFGAEIAAVGLEAGTHARGPDGLVNSKPPGAPSKLNDDHRCALAQVVEAGPIPAIHGVVRWRRKDLARWIWEAFGISLDETTVGRELKALGFAKISARPRHYAQNELAIEAFKKTSPPNWRRSGRGSRRASR